MPSTRWGTLPAVLAVVAYGGIEDKCTDDRCDELDEFATLQIHRHDGTGSIATDEPEWMDAMEVEREYFERNAALIESSKPYIGWTPPFQHPMMGKKAHHPMNPKDMMKKAAAAEAMNYGRHYAGKYFKPTWLWPKDPKFVANVQAPPVSAPYGPFKHAPFEEYDAPSEPLRKIHEVKSHNGLLDTVLFVKTGWLEVPGTGVRIKTRLYNGSYPGPTIRVRRGDQVNIKVVNELSPEGCGTTKWQRREGQATNEFPDGIPKDNARYQNVGQSDDNPFEMKPKTNNMHDINVTNLHVHGWHVSPHEPQDDVLDVKIGPGESYQYKYELSPYHSSGNSWYHAHWHGAVTMQTNGGMVGALIIDDEEGEAPEWIRSAREELFVIHEAEFSYYGPSYLAFEPEDAYSGCFPWGSTFTVQCALGHRTGLMANLTGDNVYRMQYQKGFGYEVGDKTPITAFWSVNGQYRPTMEMQTGEWVRLRVILVSGNFPINPIFNASSPCEMGLISKDSAWINQYPRDIKRGMFLGAGNRCQVMIRCTKSGTFPIYNNATSYAFTSIDPQQIFAYVKVTGADATKTPYTVVNAVRPRYLNDLYNLPESEVHNPDVPPPKNQYNDQPIEVAGGVKKDKTIMSVMGYDFPGGSPGLTPIPATGYMHQPVRFVINNLTFSHERPQATFPVGKVIQLEAGGLDTHSWHMHVNPVQFTDFPGTPDYKEIWGGYFEIGDWADVLQLANPAYDVRAATTKALVRFQTDCYNGALVVHCHVLYHEDLGMMTHFTVTGNNHVVNDKFKNYGVFADPPPQCKMNGQKCAIPYCTDYRYAA